MKPGWNTMRADTILRCDLCQSNILKRTLYYMYILKRDGEEGYFIACKKCKDNKYNYLKLVE